MSLRVPSIVLRRNIRVGTSLSRANRVNVRPKATSKRDFSSESSPATKSNALSPEASSAADSSTVAAIESVVRHGPGDRVMCLDVGGKHFYTLRSTIAANPVLSNIVARAEANGELTSSGSAVFVDRDPKHFATILTYLRNKSDGLSYSDKTGLKKGDHRVQLPKDSMVLAELYVEASYFQIEPLKDALCQTSIFTWIASATSGKQNPFNMVSNAVKALRTFAIGVAGFGGTTLSIKQFTGSNDEMLTEEKEQPPPTKDLAPA